MNRCRLDPGSESGQSLVEFALVVPLLLLLLVGIIEFGRAWNISQAVAEAARQGARLATVLTGRNATESAIRASVDSVVSVSLANSNIGCDACVTLNGRVGVPDSSVAIRVAVPYRFVILGPVMRLAGQNLTRGSIMLSSRAVMRNE